MRPSRMLACTIAIALAAAAPAARADTATEARAVFERFVTAQNAHDTTAVRELLVDSPDFLWITRGTAIWGRAAAIQRFAVLYQGTWSLDPDRAGLRVVARGRDAVQLSVPVTFTIGAPGQPAAPARFLLNQVLVREHGAWKIASILPIPVPQP